MPFLPPTRAPSRNTSGRSALDPDDALAWSGLPFTYAGSTINGDARPLEIGPRARDAAAQAIRSNPNLAEAQLAVG
jgi:hypothetical protein